jgi:5-methylcytosine-specific restriction enzyme A
VALKLANFAAIDPAYQGAGMSRGGRGDRAVWDGYHDRRDELGRLAAAITAAARSGEIAPTPVDDEDEAREEGRLLYRRHRTFERDRRLVERKKAAALAAHGRLACEVCGFDFEAAYGSAGSGYIECHHLLPLHEAGRRRNRLSDLALLCANCHRVAHRVRPWPSIAELRAVLAGAAASDG